MMTLKEVAAALRISEESARLLCVSGKLRGVKAGTGATSPWRVSEEAFAEFIAEPAVPAEAS